MASKKSTAGEALGLFTDFVQGVRGEIKKVGGNDAHLEGLRDPALWSFVACSFVGQSEYIYRLLINEWESFYRALGIHVNLSTLRIPPRPDGAYRLLVVAPGLTIEGVLTECKKHFLTECSIDNLEQVIESTRVALSAPYAIWVRDTQEADPIHANKSYDDCQKEGVVGITLMERLLYELKYFLETGLHLDIQNITRCDGTLYRAQGVVVTTVCWDDKLRLLWAVSSDAFQNVRVREVVR